MDFLVARRALLPVLLGILAAPGLGAAPCASCAAREDGYLTQQVEILVYPSETGFEQNDRGLTLEREVSLFKGYLWRYSLRHLSVETRVDVIHRRLGAGEFRDYGPRFGFLLDRSPEVEGDLRALGAGDLPLLLVYDSPPDRPSRIAGRTFFQGTHSSIPLSPRYFQQDGFYRPLHLVMAHEYLHQIDLAFSRLHLPSLFLDPDGAGRQDYPSCIDPGGGDLSLRTILQYDRSCRPVDWERLAPAYGSWVPR